MKTFWSGFGSAISLVAIMLVMVGTGFAQGEKEGQGQAVVTILPKHEGDAAANISAQNAKLKIGGKDTNITNLDRKSVV